MSEKYFEGERFDNIELNCEILSDYEFIACDFFGCTISESKLMNCLFSECKFYNCNVTGLKTEKSEIRYAEFSDCVLVGINWALLVPSIRFADPIQKLTNCSLRYNNFMNFTFKKFDFSGSDYSGSMFAECIITECSFNSCPLNDTEFFKCDLRKTDFRNALGYKIDILSCQMKGSRFSYTEAPSLLNSLEIKLE